VELLEERRRARPHGRLVEPAHAIRDLVAGENVRRHREIRKEERLLVHDADAGRQCVMRAADAKRGVAPHDLAAVGAQDARDNLEQRRFTRAILTDAGVRFPFPHGKAHAAERAHGTERLVNVSEFEACHQPSAVSHQPSAISHQPSVISHQPSAISHPSPVRSRRRRRACGSSACR
jgi:hypothetical protein